jgi:uncharacterized delta-60 repeat protein
MPNPISAFRETFRSAVLALSFLTALVSASALPPKILTLSQQSAVPGEVIVVHGSNFSAIPGNNIVTFGAVRGEVISGTVSELTVKVPSGATMAPVVVNVPGSGLAFSSISFIPRFAPVGNIASHSFGQVNSNTYPSQPLKPPLVDIANAGIPVTAQSPVICDFDGDGKPDIAVANLSGAVSILRNTHGSAILLAPDSFTRVLTFSGGFAVDIACGDLNGDGKVDLVTGDSSGQLRVFRNTSTPGSISFASPISRFLPSFVNSSPSLRISSLSRIKLTDVDSDGWLDVVAAASNIIVYRNSGAVSNWQDAPFSNPVGFSTADTAADLALADFNGDSKPDLCVAAGRTVRIFKNTAAPGTLTASSFAPAIVLDTPGVANGVLASDLNSDGTPEVAVLLPLSISFFAFNGNSETFSAGAFLPRIDPVGLSKFGYLGSVLASDLDGDGKPEIIVRDRDARDVSVALNNGSASLAAAFNVSFELELGIGQSGSKFENLVAIGDLNADTKPDFVVVRAETGLAVSQNFALPLSHLALAMNKSGDSVKLPWFRTATYSLDELLADGGKRNVTLAANWESSAAGVAQVVGVGVVTGKTYGAITVSASYGGHESSASLNVLPTAFGVKPGEPDKRFLPEFSNNGAQGVVSDLELLADGKVLVAGEFSHINGVPVRNIARFLPDGSLDASFDAGTGPDGRVNSLCLDAGGKILIAGTFKMVNGVARRAVARLHANGSLDDTFNTALSSLSDVSPNVIAMRTDGRIVVGGAALSLEGQSSRYAVIQFLPSGALDSTFTLVPMASYSIVYALLPMPDGKLLIGGTSLQFGNSTSYSIRMLNAGGAPDASFNPPIESTVYCFARRSDGRILVGGALYSSSETISDLVSLNPDGSFDRGFLSTLETTVNDIALQVDGKIVAACGFRTERLNPNGTSDSTWAPAVRPDWSAKAIKVAADEKIWICGGLSASGGLPTMGAARLHGGVTTFLGWQSKYFSQPEVANEGISGPGVVTPGSRVTNLYRYAAGLAPEVVSVEDTLPRIVPIGEGSDGAFTYRRPIGSTDLLDEAGVSRDLVTWDFSGDHIVRVGTPITNEDGVTETVKFRYLPPDGNDTAAFFKLRLSLKP